jgi:hypothetical protein
VKVGDIVLCQARRFEKERTGAACPHGALRRRCALCGRIGAHGFERSASEGRWVCADRVKCAERRTRRQ